MKAPLIEQLPEKRLYRGRNLDGFLPSGPLLPHRGHHCDVQLLIPCDLSNLDACLRRLPQDKPRMGFRLNVNMEPWMLRPSGNWGKARISRTDGRRLGWKQGDLFAHPEGICLGLPMPGSKVTYYRPDTSDQLPSSIQVAQAVASFSERLNADPSGVEEFGLDSSTHCMCCGKGLTVQKSKTRGVGPECLSVLDSFLGTHETIAELETIDPAEAGQSSHSS